MTVKSVANFMACRYDNHMLVRQPYAGVDFIPQSGSYEFGYSLLFSMTSNHHLLPSKHGIFVDLCSPEKLYIKLSPDGIQDVCFFKLKGKGFKNRQFVKKHPFMLGPGTFS
jgi:hypothetical protein